jgi:ribosome-associated protein
MNTEILLRELQFKAVRSSGPGGQHVNKTSSKIEVSFDLINSEALSDVEKHRLQKSLASRLTNEGILQMQCSESRSQHRNKAMVIERLIVLLKENSKAPKKRKKTKPSKSAIQKRLTSKKNHALKKANRKRPPLD